MLYEIWASFRRLPVWVQLWMALWLVPVNLAPLALLEQPGAIWVAVLSVGGMLPNLWILIQDRGFSRRMALPHLLIWIPLVVVLTVLLQSTEVTGLYRALIWALLVTDLISLGFDLPDSWRWWRGARDIA